MARALTQNVAWVLSFLLSSITFAVIGSLAVMMAQDSHAGSPSAHASQEAGDGEGHGVSEGGHTGEDHGKSGDAETEKPAHHEAGHEGASAHSEAKKSGSHEAAEEEEISADSFKKSEHAEPHH